MEITRTVIIAGMPIIVTCQDENANDFWGVKVIV